MKPSLYPHQRKAIREIKPIIARRNARVVLSCPTAGGKTRIAAEIIRSMLAMGKRVTFTAPKLEIINQTVDRLIDAGVPGSKIGVIQADHERTDDTRAVQVASVQTITRRDYPKTDLVIVDECHEQFGIIARWMEEKKRLPFLGLSATPWARGMAERWTDGVIEAGDTQSLIDAKVLCDFRVFLRERYDTRAVHIRNGDYVPGELNEAAKDKRVTADIIKSWKKHGQSRPTVAFCVSREHAQSLTERFRKARVSAAYMDGDTPEKVRADIRARFHAGKIKVICNVGVLTTGADWNIGCIILARPTQSKILFVQIIGRGLRNPPGKTDCLILDHTNNHELHGRVTDIAAEGLRSIKVKDDDYFKPRGPVVTQCEACGEDVPASAFRCPNCDAAMPRSVLEEREQIRLVELVHDKSLAGRSVSITGQRVWSRIRSLGQRLFVGSVRIVSDEQHNDWCRRLNQALIQGNLEATKIAIREEVLAFRYGCTPGYETVSSSARRVGRPDAIVRIAIKRGELRKHGRLVKVAEVDEWVRSNTYVPQGRNLPPGHVNKGGLCLLMGWAENTNRIDRMVAQGLPTLGNGLFDAKAAKSWIATHGWQFLKACPPAGYETKADFSRRIGRDETTISRAIKHKGMPSKNGYVHVESALNWLKKNPIRTTSKPTKGYVGQHQFAKRIGTSQQTVKRLVAVGLPCDSNGFIPLTAGMEWVAASGWTKGLRSSWFISLSQSSPTQRSEAR